MTAIKHTTLSSLIEAYFDLKNNQVGIAIESNDESVAVGAERGEYSVFDDLKSAFVLLRSEIKALRENGVSYNVQLQSSNCGVGRSVIIQWGTNNISTSDSRREKYTFYGSFDGDEFDRYFKDINEF